MVKKSYKTLLTLSILFVTASLFPNTGSTDSFVDESVVNALEDFKSLHSIKSIDSTHEKKIETISGDSFVDRYTVEKLKDFKFHGSEDSQNRDIVNTPERVLPEKRVGYKLSM